MPHKLQYYKEKYRRVKLRLINLSHNEIANNNNNNKESSVLLRST